MAFSGLNIKASADKTVQHYHFLEGMPIGWSLDMLVPAGIDMPGESAVQGCVELSYSKRMDDLVYYKYAQSLFSGALSAWEENIDVGRGRSYGAELMYEYSGDDVSSRIAYTVSKTDRYDFERINEGRPFHARFDRSPIAGMILRLVYSMSLIISILSLCTLIP